MTPPTKSPLLTLATLHLAGGAVSAPVSGVVVAPDGAPAPDFAAALAGLLVASVTAEGRPGVAVPGKPLPVGLAKTAAKNADAAPPIALLAGEVPPVLVAAKPEAGDKDTPPQQEDDDPTLDPALCWLMPPVETAPVAKTPSVMPPVRATASPLPRPVVAAVPTIAPAPVTATEADALPAEVPIAPTRAAQAAVKPDNIVTTPEAPVVAGAPVVSVAAQPTAPRADIPQTRGAPAAPATVTPFPQARAEALAAAASVVVAPPAVPAASTVVAVAPAATAQLPDGPVVAPLSQPTARVGAVAPATEAVVAPAVSAPPVLTANATAARPVAAPTVPAPAAPRPAAEVFAEALATPAPRRTQPDQPDITGSALQSAAQLSSPIAVQQTGDAQRAGIDLTRDPGIHKMIDHIEHLRDAADARDTRIRLIPDSLGPVGVSVRQDGDRISVHFTADHATTRALIADAQPRLNEIAESRGVRITQTTVDAGTGGNQPRPQPQTAAATPSAPPRADNETEDSSDARVA